MTPPPLSVVELRAEHQMTMRLGWARYTRSVGWNLRTISITMLTVLCLLPVSETLCVITCDGAPESSHAATHHHQAANEATPNTPDAPQIAASSSHPCDHTVAVQQAITPADRAQFAISMHAAIQVSPGGFAAPRLVEVAAFPAGPPGSPPSTSTPLVLRV